MKTIDNAKELKDFSYGNRFFTTTRRALFMIQLVWNSFDVIGNLERVDWLRVLCSDSELSGKLFVDDEGFIYATNYSDRDIAKLDFSNPEAWLPEANKENDE